jgi:hypothetical protein
VNHLQIQQHGGRHNTPFAYRIPTMQIEAGVKNLHNMAQSDAHPLVLYERAVDVQAKDDSYHFTVQTLRRYGSSPNGGYPAVSVQLDAELQHTGDVEGEAYWCEVAVVRAIGISILATVVFVFSVFIMEWSWRNAILIVGWVGLLIAVPAYFWLELWWDKRTLIRDVERYLRGRK